MSVRIRKTQPGEGYGQRWLRLVNPPNTLPASLFSFLRIFRSIQAHEASVRRACRLSSPHQHSQSDQASYCSLKEDRVLPVVLIHVLRVSR